MIGSRCALEIRHVAADAGGVRCGQVVIPIHMALRARHSRVESSQRESRGRVVEARAAPIGSVVTLLAGLR